LGQTVQPATQTGRAVFAALPEILEAPDVDALDSGLGRLAQRLDWLGVRVLLPGRDAALLAPVQAAASGRDGPVGWQRLWEAAGQGALRGLLAGWRRSGARDGLAVPVWREEGLAGCVLVSGAAAISSGGSSGPWLVLVAEAAVAASLRIEATRAQAGIHLTLREIECLSWVLEGKTNWEIGMLTGVTPRTVQFHLSNAAQKLEAGNRVQAGVRALMRGLVPAPLQVGQAPGNVTAG
jgi:DNA-binding CsgD family transcriptional regulator